MRTTKEISERYKNVCTEINRISNILINSDNALKENDKYTYSCGTEHPEWTFKQALISYISAKSQLEWVLGMK